MPQNGAKREPWLSLAEGVLPSDLKVDENFPGEIDLLISEAIWL